MVVRKPAFIVDDFDFVWRGAAPRPKHEVAVGMRCAEGKAGDDNPRAARGDKAFGQGPGRYRLTIACEKLPRATQIARIDLSGGANRRVGEVKQVRDVDAISADRERLSFEGKSLLGFEPSCLDREGRIEARGAHSIEASAMQPGSVARLRCKGPGRMVSSICEAFKPRKR